MVKRCARLVPLLGLLVALWSTDALAGDQLIFDVAYADYPTILIFRAQVTAEEVYDGSDPAQDPRVWMAYFHYHPVYMIWGYGFVDWPGSEGGHNNVLWMDAKPNWQFCPVLYGAVTWYAGDSRFWGTYSGGQTCDADPMF